MELTNYKNDVIIKVDYVSNGDDTYTITVTENGEVKETLIVSDDNLYDEVFRIVGHYTFNGYFRADLLHLMK